MLDALAQQLDAEVLRLDQEGVAAPRTLRADARPQPLRAMGTALHARFELCGRLLRIQLRPHLVADRRVAREVEGVWSCQQDTDALGVTRTRRIVGLGRHLAPPSHKPRVLSLFLSSERAVLPIRPSGRLA